MNADISVIIVDKRRCFFHVGRPHLDCACEYDYNSIRETECPPNFESVFSNVKTVTCFTMLGVYCLTTCIVDAYMHTLMCLRAVLLPELAALITFNIVRDYLTQHYLGECAGSDDNTEDSIFC